MKHTPAAGKANLQIWEHLYKYITYPKTVETFIWSIDCEDGGTCTYIVEIYILIVEKLGGKQCLH